MSKWKNDVENHLFPDDYLTFVVANIGQSVASFRGSKIGIFHVIKQPLLNTKLTMLSTKNHILIDTLIVTTCYFFNFSLKSFLNFSILGLITALQ